MNRIRRTLARGARPAGTGEPHSRQPAGREPHTVSRPGRRQTTVGTEGTDGERRRLTADEILRLNPYQLLAELDKNVIHPGGRRSTGKMLELAALDRSHHVLEVGCGVGATAIEIARRYGCRVTAVDYDPDMVEKARANVAHAGVADRVGVEHADVMTLPFADDHFDRVIVEAVVMFTDRPRAIQEIVRVTKMGGRVLDQELIWRHDPDPKSKRIFECEVCVGVVFQDEEDWRDLYQRAGLRDLRLVEGPFTMMYLAGFLRDEGLNTFRILGKALSRLAYIRRMQWLMTNLFGLLPAMGYVILAGTKIRSGAPLLVEDHVLERLNKDYEKLGLPPLRAPAGVCPVTFTHPNS